MQESSAAAPLFKSPAHVMALGVMVTAYFAAVTHPFRLFINGAELEPGLATFARAGVLHTAEPVPWVRAARDRGYFAVHLRVRGFELEQDGPARILTVSPDTTRRNLTVGQSGTDLVVRLRRSASTFQGTPPYVVPGVFADGETHDVHLDLRQETFQVRVDEVLRIDEPLPERPLSHWDASFVLGLGNELTWDRPWLGQITVARLECGAESWDLLAPGALHRPESFSTNNEPVVLSGSAKDLLLNFSAFVPFGFVTAAGLWRPRTMTVLLIWLPICVAAEGAQVFFAGRHPSVSDFVLNVSGAVVGAALFTTLPPLRRVLRRLDPE